MPLFFLSSSPRYPNGTDHPHQTLTVAYHTTQRHINIRRETRETISIFSLASFISMACLLIQLHLSRVDTAPVPPIFQLLGRAWELGIEVLRRTGLGPVGRDL